METLTFNEAAHSYKLGSRELPSVTTILKDVGLIDATHFNDYAMTRGTFVHQACEMVDLDTLDEEQLDPALVGYVAAYKRFRAEMDIKWTEIESPRHDASLGFAGTPDRIAEKTVVDIKTGAPQPWHGPQLAAYTMLAHTAGASTLVKRYGLYLSDDGTYKLKRYENKGDFDVFRAAVVIYHAKRGMI
jgi:hypothetical protein